LNAEALIKQKFHRVCGEGKTLSSTSAAANASACLIASTTFPSMPDERANCLHIILAEALRAQPLDYSPTAALGLLLKGTADDLHTDYDQLLQA
jgi:hypothetical protein